jgi:hypothetical protein
MVIRVTIYGTYGIFASGHTVVYKFKAGGATFTLPTITPGVVVNVRFKLVFNMTIGTGTTSNVFAEYSQSDSTANNLLVTAAPAWTKTSDNNIDVTATISNVGGGDNIVTTVGYVESLANT